MSDSEATLGTRGAVAAAGRGNPPATAGGAAPRWFILLTIGATLVILFMAVAETTLWTHYLVDRGESLSLIGLAFVSAVGLLLYRQRRLAGSLPLAIPWLIYPVLTQGDQLIDHLSIGQMRLVCHLILAVLFGAPIWVLLMAARAWIAPASGESGRAAWWTLLFPGLRPIAEGRGREGEPMLVSSLLLLEVWVAHRYLGTLMILTLLAMGLGYLASVSVAGAAPRPRWTGRRRHRLALVALLAGVALSLGLYLGFKNRPGAYQGSPHFYHDPARADAAYPMEAIEVPEAPASVPDAALANEVRRIVASYAGALERLFDAYYILDRNYNYAFHNELFLRATPVMPGFRPRALASIAEARALARDADARRAALADELAAHPALSALLDEAAAYTAFSFRRASMLEEMSARFESTRAGLQHATHLYEGEGKVLGARLMDALDKHRAVAAHPEAGALVASLIAAGESIRDAYANRIVGF